MDQFTVRNIEEEVKVRFKQRAMEHGISLGAEVRLVLRNAVKVDQPSDAPGLGSRIAVRFAKVGLTEALPAVRGQAPRRIDFGQ